MSILLLESLHPEAEALLEAADDVLRAPDPNGVVGDLSAVRAILTRGRGRIDEALMQRCGALRAIARVGAGLDNLDTAAAKRRGVVVIFAPGANTDTVAEHTLALMLDLVRGITRSANAVAAGRWEERGNYAGNELRGLLLGIVGFGHIGQRTAELASAFGMGIAVAEHPGRAPIPPGYASLPLDRLLAQADVVSLHMPLNSATRACIGARELASMKPTAWLINTARGALIDQSALRDAIAGSRIAGFAADVLDPEPPVPGDPLLESDRVLITPHVASLTAVTYRAMCLQTAASVLAVLRGAIPAARSVFS
ncbi:MAG TPA: NAD(P)-dependent oxidoreductase [Planctomycetota bacterium]|nr:NAD(P)-dependent oxidoreductase [Planctomycetota bacterium]